MIFKWYLSGASNGTRNGDSFWPVSWLIADQRGVWQLAAFDRTASLCLRQCRMLVRSKCSRDWTGHVWSFIEVERREGSVIYIYIYFFKDKFSVSVGAKIWIKFVWLVIIQSLWCLIEVTDSSVEIYRVFTFFFGGCYSELLIYSFYVQFDLLSNVINHLFGINMSFVSIVGRLQIRSLRVLVIHIFFFETRDSRTMFVRDNDQYDSSFLF